METIVVPISSLTLDPTNARKHSDLNLRAIASSLQRFGQRKPIVVQGNIVLAGNGTLEAAKSIGPYRDWETDRKSTRLNSSH